MALIAFESDPSRSKAKISTTYFSKYTLSALCNEVASRLSSHCECTVFLDADSKEYLSIHNPYQEQANRLIYRVNVYAKTPEFIIHSAHLPQTLIYELQKLSASDLDNVITSAVRRLYESADYDYFHTNGVHCKVVWRFED
jgi:hypothetical protein